MAYFPSEGGLSISVGYDGGQPGDPAPAPPLLLEGQDGRHRVPRTSPPEREDLHLEAQETWEEGEKEIES